MNYEDAILLTNFRGVWQQNGDSSLATEYAYQAYNMATERGRLARAAGYEKTMPPLPDRIGTLARFYRRHIEAEENREVFVAVTLDGVYTYIAGDEAWIKRYPENGTLFRSDFDYVTYEAAVDGETVDILVMTNNQDGMICIYGSDLHAERKKIQVVPDGPEIRFGVLGRHAERIWGAGVQGEPDNLYYSHPYDPFNWSANEAQPELGGGMIQQPTWDGDEFIALKAMGGYMIAIRKNSMFIIRGTDPGTYVIDEAYGDDCPRAENSMMWDDEDRDKYDTLEENVKAENYVAGFIGKNAILIPRGQSPLFAVGDLLGRRIADGMLEERRKGGDWKSYLRHEAGDDVADGIFGILDSMNPIESGLFSPLIGITFNRNAFGDEIVPDYMKNWQKQDQYDDYTSTVAVWLGKLGIMSPKQIHYLIDQQFGIVGDTLLNLTTPAKGYTDGLEGFGRLLAQSTVGGFYRGVNVKAAAYEDFQYYKEQFEEGLLDTYKRCDGDRETMNSWVSKALSPREFAKAMNDAEKIGDYLKETQSAIYKLNDKIRKNPDSPRAETWERQATLLALEACQVGESWMRRYQAGDLSVVVNVPKGK